MYLTPLGLALKNAPGVFVVILNKRRVTQTGTRLPSAPAYSPSVDISGAFSVTTRRTGTIFAAAFVVNHLCRQTTLRAFRLAGHKNSRQQWWIKDKQALTVRHISIIRIALSKKIWQSLRGLVITSSTSGLFQAYSQAA